MNQLIQLQEESEADLCWKTVTFQRMRDKILDFQYKIVFLDIRRGYGSKILLREVEKKWEKQLLLLEINESFYSMYHFAVWLEHRLHQWKPDQFEKNCFLLQQYKNVNHAMKKYMVCMISKRLNKSKDIKNTLMITGVQHLRSQEILSFIKYMNHILAEQAKIFVSLDGIGEVENMFGFPSPEILIVKTKDMLLNKGDIQGMIMHYHEEYILKSCDVEQLTDVLFHYFGGWPCGIHYALDLLIKEQDGVTLDFIYNLKNHAFYLSYCRYFITEGMTEEEINFLLDMLDLSSITSDICNKKLSIQWAEGYLERWEEVGCLICEHNTYRLSGLIRDYLLSAGGLSEKQDYSDVIYEGNKEVMVVSLGGFSVRCHGKEPRWRTKKVKELFVVLFCQQGGLITKDAIVARLWPDYNDEKASQLFFTTMSYLRKNLAEIGLPELVLTKKKSYCLNIDMIYSDYQILLEIKDAIDHGWWAQIQQLPDIRTIYKGGFLELCVGEWCYGLQTYVERICLQCLRGLALYEMSLNNYQPAAEYLHFFIQINPYSNDVVGMILHCYGNMKDFGCMKQIYEEVKKLYSEEFNMDVDSDITEIYQKYIPEVT